MLTIIKSWVGAFLVVCGALAAHGAGMSLRWDAPPPSGVVRYRVYQFNFAGIASLYQEVPASTLSVPLENQKIGAAFAYAVTSVSQDGTESDFSDPVMFWETALPLNLFSFVANLPPTLNSIADVSIRQNAGKQSVSLTGISSGWLLEKQSISVTAVTSNSRVTGPVTVGYLKPNSFGTLTFTPPANQSGTAIITVTVSDGTTANNLVTRSFRVTVNPPPEVIGLVEAASDARSFTLNWKTENPATCVVKYGLKANLGQISASTTGTNHSVTLFNLQPATIYFLKVEATSAWGNSATEILTAATDASRVAVIEAERGVLTSPMAILDDPQTQEGRYIISPKSGTGVAAFDINVGSAAGDSTFRVWARVKAPVSGGTFFVSFDAGAERVVTIPPNPTASQWRWVLLGDGKAEQAFTFTLKTGVHRLKVRAGTANCGLDEIMILNDPVWLPILDTTVPELSLAAASSTYVDLTCRVNAANAQNIAVEWSLDGVNYTLAGVVPITQSKIRVSSLARRTRYYFRVTAFNPVERTGYSNVIAWMN